MKSGATQALAAKGKEASNLLLTLAFSLHHRVSFVSLLFAQSVFNLLITLHIIGQTRFNTRCSHRVAQYQVVIYLFLTVDRKE